jgi:rhodanese-related sulfurtransferase
MPTPKENVMNLVRKLFQGAHPEYVEADVHAVAKKIGEARIIDVREPIELRGELGRIAVAESVPLSTVGAAAKGWDRDEELVVVCRSGGRSGRAAAILANLGFRRVTNMTGGMLAWNEAGLGVERGR